MIYFPGNYSRAGGDNKSMVLGRKVAESIRHIPNLPDANMAISDVVAEELQSKVVLS